MNILITGGNGFIAQHLVKFLANTHTVFAPGKLQLNCLDKTAVDKFFDTHSIDLVIHTALTGREDLFSTDLQYLVDAMSMWYNICDNHHKFKKLIQFGSAYELDIDQPNVNISLRDILRQLPKSSYGKAKHRMAWSAMGIDNFYTLRLFGNMHYSEKPNRFFKKLSTSDVFIIDKDRKFDYFNLEDIFLVVDMLTKESPFIRDINLVYRDKLTLSEQVNLFCYANKISPTIIVNSTGYELTGDSSNLESFNLPLQGLVKGFEKYSQIRMI